MCECVCVRESVVCLCLIRTYAEDNLEEQASERGLGLYV